MTKYEELLNMVLKANGGNIIFEETVEIPDTILEKAAITNVSLDSVKNMTFEVFTKEGESTPHFHLFTKGAEHTKDGSKKKTFHTCICLHEAKYFQHGTKNGTLTNDDIDIMVVVLNSKSNHKDYKNKTVWEAMATRWNECRDKKVELDKMPDYALLKE